jgi:hypothetical protein
VATPFVQGKLRDEPLSFEITSECACCGRPLRITMRHDLNYALEDPGASPLFFVPMVDFTRLREPSILDAF